MNETLPLDHLQLGEAKPPKKLRPLKSSVVSAPTPVCLMTRRTDSEAANERRSSTVRDSADRQSLVMQHNAHGLAGLN